MNPQSPQRFSGCTNCWLLGEGLLRIWAFLALLRDAARTRLHVVRFRNWRRLAEGGVSHLRMTWEPRLHKEGDLMNCDNCREGVLQWKD